MKKQIQSRNYLIKQRKLLNVTRVGMELKFQLLSAFSSSNFSASVNRNLKKTVWQIYKFGFV